jgi:hypothetical protein
MSLSYQAASNFDKTYTIVQKYPEFGSILKFIDGNNNE